MSDGTLDLADGTLAACAGKTFEHHVRIGQAGPGVRWRCSVCGTTGDGMEVNKRLMPLALLADEVRTQTARIPVILLPSGSPPGLIGQFCGYDLYRVQGIERPVVAVPGLGG